MSFHFSHPTARRERSAFRSKTPTAFSALRLGERLNAYKKGITMQINQVNEFVVTDEHVKIAELSRKIGQILVERGDYEQAMYQFQLGLQYLEGLEHNEVARIYNEIGRVYWHQGKLQEAQEWTEKALDLAKKSFDPDELARLLYFVGIRYFRQGENQLAKEHWLRSLEICGESGDLPMQARLYQNLGWQSKTMGQYEKALRYLEKGKAIASESRDISTLSVIYETLGETHYVLGEWEQAIEDLQESLNLTEQVGLRKAASRVFSALGDIYRHQGKLAEADECYQRGLASITSVGSSQSLFAVNLGLGLLNMERKRYKQARQFLERCWAITSEGVGFTCRMATVKAYMGELLVRMGELDEAAESCIAALDLAEKAETKPQWAQAKMVEGMIATRRGDWKTAEERFNQALEIFKELGDKYHQGRVYFELGLMYQDNKAQREAFLGGARAIFSSLGAKNELNKFPPER